MKKHFNFLLKDQQFFKFEANRDRVFRVFKKHFNDDSLDQDGNKIVNEKAKMAIINAHNLLANSDDSNFGEDFWNNVTKSLGNLKPFFGRKIMGFLYEIIIGLLYPKIDAHVSAQTNHLLKGPFNIHSSSGNFFFLINIRLDQCTFGRRCSI